jgi:hypothetical protein
MAIDVKEILDVDRYLQGLASSTSRRSFVTRVGTGLIGATLLVTSPFSRRSAEARDCTLCGGCSGGEACGSTGGTCCDFCRVCPNGFFCQDVYTSLPYGECPAAAPFQGWVWYCCTSHQLWICQDCCRGQNDCYCTSRGPIDFC